jgi:hypothetical protein
VELAAAVEAEPVVEDLAPAPRPWPATSSGPAMKPSSDIDM